MREIIIEWLAILAVIGTLVLLPLGIWTYDQQVQLMAVPDGEENVRIVEVTGMSGDGCSCWVEGKLAGWNYWWRDFPHAQIRVKEGEHVILRLTSSDVAHSLSIPQLRIGPVPVEPGHVTTVGFTAEEPDSLTYTCYTVCGKNHAEMMGMILVQPADENEEIANRSQATSLN